MLDNPDASQPKPSAFERDPETQGIAGLILSLAAGIDSNGVVERLDNETKLKWQGVVAQIEGVGPQHGKEILRLLSMHSEEEDGISLFTAKGAIELYCKDHHLSVPQIPENAKTFFDGMIWDQ